MTIVEFSAKRNIDWTEVTDYLGGSGYDGSLEPTSTIAIDWLWNLEKEFPLQEGGSEKEQEGFDIPLEVVDEKTKAFLEAEANTLLQNESIDSSKINIEVKNLTLDILIRRLENNGELVLDPDFQRSGNLWSAVKQSQLIESILVKLPLPAFYFDASNENSWTVIDGLQRLSAIENFVVKKNLKLEGLEFLENLHGQSFDNLPRPIQRRIQETSIVAYLIKSGTPEDAKYNIFRRINTGGLMLNSQEIRHALNQGVPADTLKEMAGSHEFKRATTYSLVKGNRMEDRDYVNRYVAFYYSDYKSYDRKKNGGLDVLLNTSLAAIKKENRDPAQLKSDFFRAMNTAAAIFGNEAFRKKFDIGESKRRKPLNKALFEVWAVLLSKLTDEERDILVKKREEVEQKFVELMNNDQYFDFSITYATGDTKRVKYRFEKINELIQQILEQ
jgi:hypothetical protein